MLVADTLSNASDFLEKETENFDQKFWPSNNVCHAANANECWHNYIQWNLRTRDTLGLIVLSLVERLSLSRR